MGEDKRMAFSRSVITERTGENSSTSEQQQQQESTSFYRRSSDKTEAASVANSCSNSSSQSSTKIQEHDYIGLAADSSSLSVDQPQPMSDFPDLNLGLHLGPPKKPLEQTQSEARLRLPSAGSKRGFSETVSDSADLVKGISSKLLPAVFPWSANPKPVRPPIDPQQQQPRTSFTPFQRKVADSSVHQFSPCLNEDTPTSSGPMVGWPPVQSFRKNTLVAAPVNQPAKIHTSVDRDLPEQIQPVAQPGCSLFVKVYMDGVPIGRKVDLDSNNSYLKLSSALKEMFSGFISGQSVSKQKSSLSTGEVHNLFDGYEAEYVLTYEDKDGDLMLVGDVPWRMFAATVKRLRIMKGSDAIGLGVPKDLEDPTRTKAAS